MTAFCKRKCWMLLAIGLIMPALSLFAQQKIYRLQDLIDSAGRYLPVLQQKTALVNAANAAITDTKHSFLPQLKFSEQLLAGSDNSLAGSFFTFGMTPSTSAGVRNENNTAIATGNIAVLYSEYELVNFGLNTARLRNAEAFAGLQQTDLEREQYLASVNIARLYFTIQKTAYRLNADRQNSERYQNIFTIIRALTASGIKPGADSSLAKAELSRAHITYQQTLGKLNQLKEQLAFFTGIPAAQLNVDTTGIQHINVQPVFPGFVMDSSTHPLLAYYAQRKNVFTTNEQLIKKAYLPKIMLAASTWARGSSIQYNDNYKALSTGLGYQRFNYAAGIAFTYNLFNGIYKHDKLAVNRFQLQASEYDLKQQEAVLHTAGLQADHALETLQASLQELPVQLQSAEDTYRQKVAQYKAGIISLVDLTNASFVLYRSQTDYIETLSDWYLALLDKAASTGRMQQFIQTIK